MAGSKTFGKRLKELRELRNLSQEQLAEKIGVEYQSISRIETGLYFTNYDNLLKISKALNVQLKDLFDYSEEKLTKKDFIKLILDKLNTYSEKNLEAIYKFTQLIDINNK